MEIFLWDVASREGCTILMKEDWVIPHLPRLWLRHVMLCFIRISLPNLPYPKGGTSGYYASALSQDTMMYESQYSLSDRYQQPKRWREAFRHGVASLTSSLSLPSQLQVFSLFHTTSHSLLMQRALIALTL